MHDVICVGDVAIDNYYRVPRLPGADEKVHAEYLGQKLGGTTFNTAHALHKLGASVQFVTQVGDDGTGKRITRLLHEKRLSSKVFRRSGMSTFSTFVIVAEDGEKAVLLFVDDDAEEARPDHSQDSPPKASVIFASAGGWMLTDLEAVDSPIVLSLEVPTIERYPESVDWAQRYANTLVLDRNAFVAVFGEEPSGHSLTRLRLDEASVRTLVVTLGRRGAMALAIPEGRVIQSPAYEVDMVDTTGAGDIFCAGIIKSRFLDGKSIEDSLRYSNAIAGASCEEMGTELSPNSIRRARRLMKEGKGGRLEKT